MANIGTLFLILWLLGKSLFPYTEVETESTQSFNAVQMISDTSVTPEFNEIEDNEFLPVVNKIVIDAGHGGHDHGCAGSQSNEKEITLAIALKLGATLKNQIPGVEVIFTRKADVFVPLYERIDLANKNDADIFLSIHANAFHDLKVNGTEVFVMGLHTAEENLAVAKRENASVLLENDFETNYDGFDPNSPEAQIILSMYQNAYLDKSISLARKITDQIASHTGFNNRGVKQAGFVILRKASMPSVLIETGFLSNLSDEELLRNPGGQQQVANAIADAIVEYRNEAVSEYEHMSLIKQKTREVVSSIHHNAIVYRVQLAAIREQSVPELPQMIAGEPIDVIVEGGMKKIIVGKFPSYESANQLRTMIHQEGTYSSTFIVAYRGKERISIEEAMKQDQNRS
jgi:N-acetylmuramoyl-L-alanine amidase